MSEREKYIAAERKLIVKLVEKIDDLWILEQIHRCAVNIAKNEKGGAA